MQKTSFCQNFTKILVDRVLIRSVSNLNVATGKTVNTSENESLKTWKEIPGPNSLPVVGAMHHFFPGGVFYNHNGLALAKALYETYGPIVRLENVIGREPQLFLYDAESAAQILQGENWMPIRPGFETLKYFRKYAKSNVKEKNKISLLTDSGDKWKELRSVVSPLMLQPKTVKLYTSLLDAVASDMVERIKSQRNENDRLKTKFSREMNLWSLESTALVALGCRLQLFDPNLSENSPAKKLIYCANEIMMLVTKLDFRPTLWQRFSTPNYNNVLQVFELQENIAKYFINIAVKEFKKKNNQADEKSILEKLMEINEDYAVQMASDMLLAGADAVANTMSGILYLLALNPEKQKKLREELRSDNDKQPYLKACVKESLRLLPISVGTRRVTTKEHNVLGYRVPPNTIVTNGHQLMSLMEEHYPRPNEYLPERWLVQTDDPLHYRQANAFAFAPFGFGVRNCIAFRIATLMLELLTARMVEEFQIEWSGPPPTFRENVINYFNEPFNFVFKGAPKL